jgi:hypothetical protein
VTRADPEKQSSPDENQVVPFRRPGSLLGRHVPPQPPQPPDLTQYQQSPEEPDDYRHRMVMNLLGFAFVVALIAGGIWIAGVMTQMRKNQDCVLTGRVGCTPVDVPTQRR